MKYYEIPLSLGEGGVNVGTEDGTDRPDRFIEQVNQPLASVVVADQPTGAVAVILPGGAYRRVCIDKEGLDFARRMARWGITSLVVTYRQPGGVFVDPPLPLVDARRALDVVGEHRQEWRLDLSKVILMGFSAGGHLALTTVREPGNALRPGYLVLGYPVVTMEGPLVHQGSRDQLLGPQPAPLVRRFSADRDWPATGEGRPFSGPVFLVHSDDDSSVPVGNSLLLADALRNAGNPVEFLRHPTGGHGYGLGPAHGYPMAPDWEPPFRAWLASFGLARLI